MPGMRVAVTGAAGFVGRHVCEGLERRGHSVVRVVRSLGGITAAAKGGATVCTMQALLTGVLEACGGPLDAVVHAAAVRHRHGVDAAQYRADNVELVERLVRALSGKAKRFVQVSSVGVYGWSDRLPITEGHPFAPKTLYGQTKVDAEALVRRVCSDVGMEWVILRPCIVYGAGDRNGMLDKLASMIAKRMYLVVGDGKNTLHHVHVDDVVAAVVAAVENPEAAGQDFIVAGPETTTLGELSSRVAAALGVRLLPGHVPLPFARLVASVVDELTARGVAFTTREPPINHEKLDVMTASIAFDTSKLRRVLGVTPVVGYAEGLQKTLGARRRDPS